MDWDNLTIEPDGDDFVVYGHGEYEETSVLAGQYRRGFLGLYPTVEDALTAYPEAEVLEHSTQCGACAPDVPDVPWDGFDPMDAGEAWEEEWT